MRGACRSRWPVSEAAQVGYPLLVTSAGGGKGMRRVFAPEELDEAVASCQREGEVVCLDHVYVERYYAASSC